MKCEVVRKSQKHKQVGAPFAQDDGFVVERIMFVWRFEKEKQILRLTTPELKKTFGAPCAQDDSFVVECSSGGLKSKSGSFDSPPPN